MHFLIQIKLRTFGKFSKNKFYTFFKIFCFQIFFFFLSKPFLISFAKAISTILNFQSKPLNQINQMQGHVCTNMLLNLMMNFNLMKIFIFLCFHEHKNSKLPQFTPISKRANFRVLQLALGSCPANDYSQGPGTRRQAPSYRGTGLPSATPWA